MTRTSLKVSKFFEMGLTDSIYIILLFTYHLYYYYYCIYYYLHYILTYKL